MSSYFMKILVIIGHIQICTFSNSAKSFNLRNYSISNTRSIMIEKKVLIVFSFQNFIKIWHSLF